MPYFYAVVGLILTCCTLRDGDMFIPCFGTLWSTCKVFANSPGTPCGPLHALWPLYALIAALSMLIDSVTTLISIPISVTLVCMFRWSYAGNDVASNMAVVAINMVSGWLPDKDSVHRVY